MDTNIRINGQHAKWSNADSRDGQVKGGEFNCVEIALHDSGAWGTNFWLQVMPDAPGLSVVEFAKRHPTGSYLVSHIYPDSPPQILPLYWKGNDHYSALVDGTLHNASTSAVENKIDHAFEVLHKDDIEARGMNLEGRPVQIPDGTALSRLGEF